MWVLLAKLVVLSSQSPSNKTAEYMEILLLNISVSLCGLRVLCGEFRDRF